MKQNASKNDANTPPFRINSLRDIDAYTACAGTRYWTSALIRIARHVKIEEPGVLEYLSCRSEFCIRLPDTVVYEEISSTPEEDENPLLPFLIDAAFVHAMRNQRAKFRAAVPIEARTYHEHVNYLATRYADRAMHPTGTDETNEVFQPSQMLHDISAVDTVVLSDIKRYIEHGDPMARNRIEQIARSLCFYVPATHQLDTAMIEVVSSSRDLTPSDHIVLFTATFDRTRVIIQRWYQYGVKEQIDRLRRRLLRLGTHPNLIRGIGDALLSISTADWLTDRNHLQEVRKRISATTTAFEEITPPATITKIRSLSEDILKKHQLIRKLFTDLFAYDVILSHLTNKSDESLTMGRDSRRIPLRKRTVPMWKRYDAYPTKDLHDLAKGIISQDCTNPSGPSGLAGKHLETPEFFNIRLFDGSKWIGNMYCLALKQNVIVVDHIQFGFTKKIAAVDLVADLRRLFVDLTAPVEPKPEVWIYYSDASNRAWLRKLIYESDFMEYRKNLVPGGKRFSSFSCGSRRGSQSTFARIL